VLYLGYYDTSITRYRDKIYYIKLYIISIIVGLNTQWTALPIQGNPFLKHDNIEQIIQIAPVKQHPC
jgi:hypothetical protein